jgi:RNA polymerase sigma-70 factor, ECF subfamily
MHITHKQTEFDRQLDLLQVREFRKTGDMEILGKIYYKYIHLVYGVCLSYFKNKDLAMDGVIHIFEKLTVEAIRNEIFQLKNWLYVTTKNYCYQELKKQNLKDPRFANWEKEQADILAKGILIHPIDEEKRLSKATLESISSLDQNQKDCVQLFYQKKKNYQEIANYLKCAVDEVKINLAEGKVKMKKFLEEKK